MPAAPTVSHNAAAGRFEARTAHGAAVLNYIARGGNLDLVHTKVPPEEEGQGIGTALARAALEHAQREGVKVVPSCPFVRAFVKEHPEFAALVATG